jgi:signal peptidase II
VILTEGAAAAPRPRPRAPRAWLWATLTALIVAGIDQGTKQLVVASIDRGHPKQVLFGIDLTNVRNKGVAFGLFGGTGDAVLILTFATLGFLLVYFALRAHEPGVWLAVGLVIGGAAGNLIDRIRIGAAVDFIDPPLWPAFNLGDIAIVTGVALLGLLMLSPQAERDD